MAVVISRIGYFETGLEVLSDLGYGALKLAEVCHRLGVTSGSFYHYFANWSDYTGGLLTYWVDTRTPRLMELVRDEPDPRRRIDRLIEIGLTLPHSAEAAIRSWSSVDHEVRAVQFQVDQQRFDLLYESALAILSNKRQAQLFADWGMYLLVGYEQTTLPRDEEALAWVAAQLLDALDSGRFASIPHQ